VSEIRVAIIGVGNLLMGDDGVGIHVVREIEGMDLPPYIEVYDAMTNSFMVLEYMDGADKAVIVDAFRRGGEPGSTYRIEFDPEKPLNDRVELSLHDMDFLDALSSGRYAYTYPRDIVIIGVEPGEISLSTELSPPLREALPGIIDVVLREAMVDD
jgi:hydrogenase maturation protease